PTHGKARAAALRKEMERRGLDGFVIPRADEHQNEYVPANAERLAWLTGFTGSAGLAIVLADRAAIFVDGRYTLQVRDQVDTKVFEPIDSGDVSPAEWLEKNLRPDGVLGYDPWLTTPATLDRYEKAARKANASLQAVTDNLVDALWTDRPSTPLTPVRLHPKKFAGVDAAKKLEGIAGKLAGADALVVTNAHNVAWAFNIRGADVPHTPLPLAFAVIRAKGRPWLYVDSRKLSNEVRDALSMIADVEEPSKLLHDVAALGRERARVLFDAGSAPSRLVEALREAGGQPDLSADPINLMKARKNAAEIRGSRAAHLRDGAAVSSFLAWFAEEAPKGRLTEIDAVMALETFRRQTKKLMEVSFPTISGAGPNGAIVHYRVTERTNRRIGKGLFLLDSGAQYEDGTTDITRTIAVGKPSAEMRDRFTRVLKGHIAVASAVFPKGANGSQLDAFARRALWDAGLDYDHGTGHGVGAFLSVHEGPQNISKRPSCALEPGMILSNEPGYYKTDAYGIRIENLVLVEKRDVKGGERETYGFETLTLAPIDLACVEPKLLTRDELRWLDAYHARVRRELSPHVSPATRKWLGTATKALSRG
ncbi:MAG: aminopeptidase P family protein, partial [Beijerinckiaceae bacterium]|nr:aminopeptidase P family protein [Beijerinckiaceae bacterium]